MTLLHDLRHATRLLAKNPGVSVVAILTLALAIGATTAVFSVVHGVLLRPLPYPEPHRLVAVWEVNDRGTYSRLADPNFNDFRDRNRTFAAMAKYAGMIQSVGGTGEPTRETVATVTRDFFDVLGIRPAVGREFGQDDCRVGAAPTVIVSHRYWASALGSASLSAVHLRIAGQVYEVIGVMPPGFEFPARADLWVPAELEAENTSRTSHNYWGVGRLREGVDAARASGDLGAIAAGIIRQSPEQGRYLMTGATVVPLQASLTGRAGPTLYLLLGAVFFLLLVACANVTNLLLAQAAVRQREIAVRRALGAGRARLVRQFVTESVVLLGAGTLLGLAAAAAGTNALVSLAPANLPRLNEVSMNAPVLAFAIGLSALVAIGLGLVTAWRASRRDPREALADARGQAGGATSRLGRVIVAVQVAITVVLLVGASLLGRSLLRVLSVDPGFRTAGLVTMDLSVPYSEEPAVRAQLAPFYVNVLDRLRAIHGVRDVATASAVPMDGGRPDGLFASLAAPEEAPKTFDELQLLFQRKDRLGTADYCAASPAYFRVLGIAVVQGRVFDERDGPDAPHAAVINESLARAQWPGVDPIGRAIEFGNMDGDLRALTVVGVVRDTREYGPELPPRPTVYVNLLQRPRFWVTVVIRPEGDRAPVVAAARKVLRELAPEVPPRFRTSEQIYSAALGSRYFNLALLGAFAGSALVLAVAGIYGVMAYSVTRRRREIGVRVALGASPGDVRRMVLGQGLATTGAGVVCGLLGALGLTRTIESLLFGVTPTDPATFAFVVALLGGAALLACDLPARRATRADPVEAMRED